jgi:hypothetical protein
MKSKLFFTTVLALLFFVGFGQQSKTFQKIYKGSKKELAYSLCEGTDASITMVGFSESFGTGKDILLVNTDSLGELQWARTYGGSKGEVANKIHPEKDGGYVVIGNTSSFDAQRKDVLIMKVRQNGSVEWAHTYGGDVNDYGFDMEHTSDGGFIIVGETNSFDAKDDIFAFKVNSLGKMEWAKKIGGDSIDYAYAVHEVNDGYVIGAETKSYGAGKYDAMVIKLDKAGDLLWAKTYGGVEDESLQDIIVLENGDLVFVGSTLSYGHENQDMLFVWTDPNGMVRLVKTLGGVLDEQALAVKKVPGDGFAIAGLSNSYNEFQTWMDAYLVRLNEKGNMRWSKTFGGDTTDIASGLEYHKESGDFLMCGETISFPEKGDNKEIFLVKVDDDRDRVTCELTNVQTVAIKLKEEFFVNGLFIESFSVDVTEKFAKVKSKEVDLVPQDICTDNELQIETDDKKKKDEVEDFGFE